MFEGRLTRLPYFLRVLAASAVAAASEMAAFDEYGEVTKYAALHVVICIAALVLMASFAVKRLHDLGRPGRHYWLAYFPFYNIYFGLQLLFQEGVATTGTALPVVLPIPVPDGGSCPPEASCNGGGPDVYCGQCGVESPANARYCWQCGVILYGAIRNRAQASPAVEADTSNNRGIAQPSATAPVHGVHHEAGDELGCRSPMASTSTAAPEESADTSNCRAPDVSVSPPTRDAPFSQEMDEEELARTDRQWLIAIALFALMVALIAIPFLSQSR